MDIQSLSMETAQSRISDQVATSMLAKSLKGASEEGAELLKMLGSADGSAGPLPEGSGARVDLFA